MSELSSSVDLNLLTLTPIMVSDVIDPVREMKYSPEWRVIAFSTTPWSLQENTLQVFELSWNTTLH